MLLPFYIGELTSTDAVAWNTHLLLQVAYLGLGASVICFLIWNIAISRLGAGRTALFGNLIPIFSSIEAVFFTRTVHLGTCRKYDHSVYRHFVGQRSFVAVTLYLQLLSPRKNVICFKTLVKKTSSYTSPDRTISICGNIIVVYG